MFQGMVENMTRARLRNRGVGVIILSYHPFIKNFCYFSLYKMKARTFILSLIPSKYPYIAHIVENWALYNKVQENVKMRLSISGGFRLPSLVSTGIKIYTKNAYFLRENRMPFPLVCVRYQLVPFSVIFLNKNFRSLKYAKFSLFALKNYLVQNFIVA